MTISGVFAQDGPLEKRAVYRYFNIVTGEHLYTSDPNESYQLGITNIGNSQTFLWRYEGIRFVDEIGNRPVYRLFNPNTGEHLYTSDSNEVSVLTTQYGWKADNNGNPAFYVLKEPEDQIGFTDTRECIDVRRLYNPNAPAISAHLLSSDTNEINTLVNQGYVDEGHLFNSLVPEVEGFHELS